MVPKDRQSVANSLLAALNSKPETQCDRNHSESLRCSTECLCVAICGGHRVQPHSKIECDSKFQSNHCARRARNRFAFATTCYWSLRVSAQAREAIDLVILRLPHSSI